MGGQDAHSRLSTALGLACLIRGRNGRDFVLKQFEQKQWKLFDAPTKEAATKFRIQLGYDCIENPDEYGIDLLSKR